MIRSLFPVLALGVLLMAGCTSGDAESSSGASSDEASAANASTANAPAANASGGNLPSVTVYKTATCGCCAKWVEHMEQAGFTVEAHNTSELSAKKNELGVPRGLRSCHTARIGDEVVEGHVPASVVKRYLRRDSGRAQGLAVPGMPTGSPGMEVEGRPAEPYDVVAFRADGRAAVYSRENEARGGQPGR